MKKIITTIFLLINLTTFNLDKNIDLNEKQLDNINDFYELVLAVEDTGFEPVEALIPQDFSKVLR